MTVSVWLSYFPASTSILASQQNFSNHGNITFTIQRIVKYIFIFHLIQPPPNSTKLSNQGTVTFGGGEKVSQKSIYICKTEFSLVFFRFRTIYLILLSLLLFLLVDFASDLFSYCTEVWTKNKTLEDTTGNIPSLKEKVKKETDNSVLKYLNTSPFYNSQTNILSLFLSAL